ncbi:hypothetical protein [Halorubellus salinus]|uniref:hypothetical protein n=1 Tax=Halorubellus salinus TaxID=755309 RepID=UPI001D0816AA|nr:hypothetical protein [Halorubellus salinus]
MRVSDVVYETDDPVDETSATALAMNEVLREPLSAFLDEQQRRLRNAGIAAGVLLVVGIGAFATGAGTLGLGLVALGVVTAGGGYGYVQTRSPDITVERVERGVWSGHSLPVQNGTMVYDATATSEETSFELERLSEKNAIEDATAKLSELEEFPVVMDRDEPVEQQVSNTLESVRRAIQSAEQHTVEVPVVGASDPAADAVETFATLADDDPVDATVAVSAEEARADVSELNDLEEMATSDDAEADLQQVSDTGRDLVQDLSKTQGTAIDLLNDHIGTAADAFGLVSYNFYCPDCQTDDIESALALTGPQAGRWHCETCRTTHETDAVVPRHRIKDDIVNPVWDQLWIEKDDQRRELYENIEDQKAELQEREFEQRREEIRSATDRIRDLRSRIRDLKTEAKAAEGKVSEIGDLMVKYERLHEARKAEFEQEVQSSFAEIDAETDRILEETRNEEQERIEEAEQAAKEKAELMREEERRREVEKFVAAQQREDARVEAQMEQAHALHSEEMEMEKRHHREQWMLETRGRTSFSGLIDKGRMKKDRVLRASAYEGGES